MLLARAGSMRAAGERGGAVPWWAAAVCVVFCGGCGGGDGEDGPGPAHLLLTGLLEHAVLESARPPELPAGTDLAWVRDGLAVIDVPLSLGNALQLDQGAAHIVAWDLPVPPTENPLGADARPVLEGVELVLRNAWEPRDADTGLLGHFWVGDGRLLLGLAPDAEPPREVRLRYCVQAAHLAGSALVRAEPLTEIARARSVRGRRHVESLALATDSSVRIPVPPRAGGRFRTRVRAVWDGPGSAAGEVAVTFELAGKTLASETLVVGAKGREVLVPTEARAADGVFAMSVRGAANVLVFAEAPTLTRPPLTSEPPNVLLVVVDTLRADRLGAFGSELGLSPALDRLAAESIVFSECWSTSSWTLPSMATMLTSTHAGEHRAWLDDRRLGRGIDTLPEHFARHGYLTAAFTGGGFVTPEFGLDRGFVTFDASGGGVAAVLERTRAWMERVEHGPWFVMAHTYEVHSPYEPPEGERAAALACDPEALGSRPADPQLFYEDLAEDDTELPRVAAALEALYDREVAYTDEVLGAFLDTLRAAGALERMLVVVTSDHGEEFGEHGLIGHADTLYVEQLHVPLIVHLPGGLRAGEVVGGPTSLIDLAPTMVAAAGLRDGPSSTFNGRSLLDPGTSPVYATRNHGEAGLLDMHRRGDRVWIEGAYVYDRNSPGTELYDLGADPLQTRNLAERERELARELHTRLEALRTRYGEQLTTGDAAAPWADLVRELQELGYVGD